MLTTNIAATWIYSCKNCVFYKKKMKKILLIVFSFSNTSKMFAWTSTSSVVSIFFRSLNCTFCNLLRNVVFPAPPHPTIMHLTWRRVNSPLLRNFLSLFSSICIFVSPLNIMKFAGKWFVYLLIIQCNVPV